MATKNAILRHLHRFIGGSIPMAIAETAETGEKIPPRYLVIRAGRLDGRIDEDCRLQKATLECRLTRILVEVSIAFVFVLSKYAR